MTLMDSVLKSVKIADIENELYFNYFSGYNYLLQNKPDSAIIYFDRMDMSLRSGEWTILKQYQELSILINQQGTVASDLAIRILNVIKQAETSNSSFTYRLYDLLAKAYYNNHNTEKAKEYTDLYYKNHPFKSHPIIAQRYHDIFFMLAESGKDTLAMRQSLDSSRSLAIHIKDSIALMRTYDYESHLYALKGQTKKALDKSRVFFEYFSRNNMLSTYWFNNLATSFNKDGQIDSAIYYYNKGIQWSGQFDPNISLLPFYSGLRDMYRMKGDYKNAMIASDSALQIYIRNTIRIENEKIEAIHTEYQTEKKDQLIEALNTTNALNRKIIFQQRWIFIAIAILLAILGLYLYNNYKRKILKAKNDQLQIENKRLLLEQKISQMQLNPHFIYNAISNLQGLISSDNKIKANNYLVSFSKLMRNFLELNRNEYITLSEEIVSLQNYIHLQQMRFEDKFKYDINTGNVDVEAVMIPPLLLQPFVENSIEHGFRNINHHGMLRIDFNSDANQLCIKIIDNGAGLQSQQTQFTTPKKSLSKVIIQERLDLLFNQMEKKAWFETSTLEDRSGWVAQITIPLITA
ncbi:histidine kinase [Niabella yanshanensis]|uniref:Histidine kinase n=1 Tax=Niabella yanshanensis TaxID=577386 RepID=A0ABZ0W6X1_9BACT|nr:histidine kinase [Niabella yanshanensis]WQD39020.1 histidine kinase [Niabella yanshanensis]